MTATDERPRSKLRGIKTLKTQNLRAIPSEASFGESDPQRLTPEQQADNRAIARRRVRIEHVNSSVKRCRMLKETIRMWKDGIRDMVMAIGCALHNLRVRCTPSWTPMV